MDSKATFISRSEWEGAARRFINLNAEKINWIDFEYPVSKQLIGILPTFYQMPSVYDFEQILKTDDLEDPISRGVSQALKQANSTLNHKLISAIHETIKDFVQEQSFDGYDEISDITRLVKEFQTIEIESKAFISERFKYESPVISLSLEVDDGIKSTLQQKGHGLRRLVIYAQLIATIQKAQRDRALSKKPSKHYTIGIEEIELYLHPLYQSILLSQLKRLVADGQYQVIYTSHLPSMVDAFDLESVVRIARAEEQSKAYQIRYSAIAVRTNDLNKTQVANADSVRERIGEVLDVNNCQSLFSRKVVLVEGNTELYALPQLLDAAGYKFRKDGVSLVSVGGKGNIEKFIFLMQEFGIPYFVIFDFDRTKGTRDKASREQTARLEKLLKIPPLFTDYYIGKRVCVFEEDFEHTFSALCREWNALDSEAKQLIGAKQESGKSLRAKYVSRRIADTFLDDDSSLALREFLSALGMAIAIC